MQFNNRPQQQQQQNSRLVAGPLPGTMDLSSQPIYPISSLHPFQNSWVIKARVTNKSEVRKWVNPKGEGRLFSFDLLDKEGGEIRVTAFKEQCDKFFPLIEVNRVYLISRGQMKVANKAFAGGIKHEYEITLDQNSLVQLCSDDGNINKVQYSFVPIQMISNAEKDAIIDVIGVVTYVGDISEITIKSTGKTLAKRSLIICDMSCHSIELNLWGSGAENFTHSASDHPIVCVKKAKVGEYQNSKNISTTGNSILEVNPDHEKQFELHQWYNTIGKDTQIIAVSGSGGGGYTGGAGGAAGAQNFDGRRLTFAQARDENAALGPDATSEYIVKGYIQFAKKENPWYAGCPDCQRKIQPTNSAFFCEKCKKTFPNAKHRYIITFQACDHTGSSWVSSFNEVGETILGSKADDLVKMKETQPEMYESLFNSMLLKPFLFKCRAKQEMYQSEMKLKVSCSAAQPLDFQVETVRLIEAVKNMQLQRGF